MASYFIPKKIESQNKFQYSHWRKYSKYKKNWHWAIRLILGTSKNKTDKKHIKIMSIRSHMLDEGNLIGGCKPIPDALQSFGFIVDDSPNWVKIDYEQKLTKDKKQHGTHIQIKDFEDKQ